MVVVNVPIVIVMLFALCQASTSARQPAVECHGCRPAAYVSKPTPSLILSQGV